MFQMVEDLNTDELLSDTQLRQWLGVSRTTLWRLRRHAGLPYGKIGRVYRYRKLEVLEWLKDHKYREEQLLLQFRGRSVGGH